MKILKPIYKYMKRLFLCLAYSSKGVDLDLKSELIVTKSIGKNIDITESKVYVNSIGSGSKIYKSTCMGNIDIGNNVCIFGEGTIISSVKSSIVIRSYTAIGQNVSIQDSNHRIDRASVYFMCRDMFGDNVFDDMSSKGDVIIEEDVWVGSNSVVLSGVTLGRGSIIGAGSIVTKDVDPYTIVVGNPARKIKDRFSPEVISELEESKWWLWEHDKVLNSKEFFLKSRM